MSGYRFTARLAPLDRDLVVHDSDTGKLVRERWTADSFQLARERPWRVKVLANHDPALEIGYAMYIADRDGWITAEFSMLDTRLGREAEQLFNVGQPISIGVRAHKCGPTLTLHWLQEISVVPAAAYKGAQIISRNGRPMAAKIHEATSTIVEPKPAKPAARKPAPDRVVAAVTTMESASRAWWRTPAGEDTELRRRLEAAGYREGSFELIIEQMEDEIYLYRHGRPRPRLSRLVAA